MKNEGGRRCIYTNFLSSLLDPVIVSSMRSSQNSSLKILLLLLTFPLYVGFARGNPKSGILNSSQAFSNSFVNSEPPSTYMV